MAYMTKCALFTVAIALAAFAPACHAQTELPCTNATGFSASYNCSATDTGMVATVTKYHHDAAMCGGGVESQEDWTVAEFMAMLAANGEPALELTSACSQSIPDAPSFKGKFMCVDNKIVVQLYATNDTTCTGDVLANESVLPECECEHCYSTCADAPTNCTEFGALTATNGGCAKRCVTTEGVPALRSFFTAVSPDLLNCTSEWADLALRITNSAAGGFWHLAPVMALVPVLFVLGL